MAAGKPSNPSQVTQSDIAAVAGCSQNAVALALRGSNRVSESRRREILRIARRMGYVRSIAAAGLRRGRSGLIGLYGNLDEVRVVLVRELLRRLHDTQYKPILGAEFERLSPWYKDQWINTLLALRVEAMVCFAWSGEPQVPTWARRTPIVFCGFSPTKPVPCDMVAMDRAGALKQAVDHLASRGHRHIALLQHYDLTHIPRYYQQAMRDAGLEPRPFPFAADEPRSAIIKRFLASCKGHRGPTAAVVITTARLASELYAASVRRGMSLPDDLAIVGYDRAPWLDHLKLPITTLEQPIDELAEHTIAVVRRRLAEPDSPRQFMNLPFKLVVRT
jgi:LacI family transcriptional regulator